MVMTKKGMEGIPGTVDQMAGGAGTGGASNNVRPRKSELPEPAGAGTPGAGANTDLFNPWNANAAFENGPADSEPGEEGSTSPGPAKSSNVNSPYPSDTHPITGTPLPTSTGTKGNILKGGRKYT